MNSSPSIRLFLTVSAMILVIGSAILLPSMGSAARPQGKAPARRGAASPAVQKIGSFQFSSENGLVWENLPTGGYRITLSGNAVLAGQGRTITAQEMSIDVPKGASDISVGRATGGVRMTMNMEGGRNFTARGSSLIFRRGDNKVDVAGNVQIRSVLEGGGYVNATGNSAEVLLGPQTATLNGNVQITLVKPDTLESPAAFSGPNMSVDLRTGNWKLFGGRTKGNFNLKPQAGKL